MTSWALPPSLVGHADSYIGEPVTPKRAATVVLLRDGGGGGGGIEAYLIRRAATMAFASGMHAFPGGTVDPRDLATTPGWAGPPPGTWAARLGLDEDTARAVVCAAVREVFEESGVLLAGPDPGTVVGDVSGDEWEAARAALVTRELGFADFLAGRALVLRTDLLAPWSRWITPEFEPRRYDTWFFAAALPDGQLTRYVGGEADRVLWTRPAAAVTAWQAGDLAMLPPTAVTLGELSGYESVAAALRADRNAATAVLPRLVPTEDGLRLEID